MKKYLFILVSFIVAALVIGCAKEAGDATSEILDLRIQKNGTVLESFRAINEFVEDRKNPQNSTNVRVFNVEGGVRFEIHRPSEASYQPDMNGNGVGWVAIWRIEEIGEQTYQTTCAVLNHPLNEQESFEVIYPLCEPGEKYLFKVQFDPIDLNNNRADQRYEFVSIVAEDGIGDIDYSKLRKNRYLKLSFDGEYPRVTLSNCIPPKNAKNVRTYIDFFAGNKDWETNNATVWIGNYVSDKVDETVNKNSKGTFSFVWINEQEMESIKQAVDAYGKDQFFAQYSFLFDLPDTFQCSQYVGQWRTVMIESDCVRIK